MRYAGHAPPTQLSSDRSHVFRRRHCYHHQLNSQPVLRRVGVCLSAVLVQVTLFAQSFSPAMLRAVLCVRGARALLHQKHESPAARVAVVLSGCGVYDGTEIHEASAILVHLSRAGAVIKVFAPDVPQLHVIDHSKGQPTAESRNVLVESARIARGDVTALSHLNVQDHDAVIFPGGFGAAKNLSSFAVDGESCAVDQDVERVLKGFNKAKKPIGLCCIAPVLAAKVIPGVEVTVGQEEEHEGKWPYAGTSKSIAALGGKHCAKDVHEVHVDEQHRVVTTPAFMCNAPLHVIHDGIGSMVSGVLKLVGKIKS
uniref:Glutamine amidotransferase class 1 domain containing 3 n=1 Tax=Leptobrachium leishanense TaxID=445787 RepID=A0A8C5QDT9_9ANUR